MGTQNRITSAMVELPDELIPTRASLIQRLKNWEDQASWQEFFETYSRLIYGVAVKRGLSKSEAQEVVQETMIAVARHMPAFKYDPALGSFKTWLLNMTRWRIADQIRKRLPLAPNEDAGEGVLHEDYLNLGAANEVSPELEKIWDDEWEKNLMAVAVAKARRSLDPQQYQIFDCYVNKGWTAEKVAKTLGVSVNQVYLAKHRVSELIAAEIKRLQNNLL
jgi:RNA polymerase sigma-70 factor (ECF subfamily)